MKKLIATVATIAFSVAFIGCGGAAEDNAGANVEVSEEDTANEEDATEDEATEEETE